MTSARCRRSFRGTSPGSASRAATTSAGARLALDHYGKGPGRALGTILAAIIAAHHAGLADGCDLNRRMDSAHRLVPAEWQHHAGPLPEAAELRPRVPPPAGGPKGFALSFLLRMLFSCLIDADFIATERFYAAATGETIERGNHTDLAVLRARLCAIPACPQRCRQQRGPRRDATDGPSLKLLNPARAKGLRAVA
nr:hypothetical protein [Ancylobacter aquaticus]